MTRPDPTKHADPAQWGYVLRSDERGAIITFETRHDAAGFRVLWEAETGQDCEIEPQPRWDDAPLATLQGVRG